MEVLAPDLGGTLERACVSAVKADQPEGVMDASDADEATKEPGVGAAAFRRLESDPSSQTSRDLVLRWTPSGLARAPTAPRGGVEQ